MEKSVRRKITLTKEIEINDKTWYYNTKKNDKNRN